MGTACPWARTPRFARRPSICPETLAPPYKSNPQPQLPVHRRHLGILPLSTAREEEERGEEEGRGEWSAAGEAVTGAHRGARATIPERRAVHSGATSGCRSWRREAQEAGEDWTSPSRSCRPAAGVVEARSHPHTDLDARTGSTPPRFSSAPTGARRLKSQTASTSPGASPCRAMPPSCCLSSTTTGPSTSFSTCSMKCLGVAAVLNSRHVPRRQDLCTDNRPGREDPMSRSATSARPHLPHPCPLLHRRRARSALFTDACTSSSGHRGLDPTTLQSPSCRHLTMAKSTPTTCSTKCRKNKAELLSIFRLYTTANHLTHNVFVELPEQRQQTVGIPGAEELS